jgi:tRNA dimethylallyltransferase
VRAWEVFAHTGRSLADWAADTPPPLLPLGHTHAAIVLDADPDWLRARIDLRFEEMVDYGALEETTEMMQRDIPSTAPSQRCLGAPHLMGHLRGEIALEEAITLGQTDTRQYAKRQRTWFRNQMPDWTRIPAGERAFDDVVAMLDKLP